MIVRILAVLRKLASIRVRWDIRFVTGIHMENSFQGCYRIEFDEIGRFAITIGLGSSAVSYGGRSHASTTLSIQNRPCLISRKNALIEDVK